MRKECSMPSDHMGKKEIRAMSSECIKYSMHKPMSWAEFKALPDFHQRQYLVGLMEYTTPSMGELAYMFDMSKDTIKKAMNKLGIKALNRPTHPSEERKAAWKKFCLEGVWKRD